METAEARQEARFGGGRGGEVAVPHRLVPGCAVVHAYAAGRAARGIALAESNPFCLDHGGAGATDGEGIAQAGAVDAERVRHVWR